MNHDRHHPFEAPRPHAAATRPSTAAHVEVRHEDPARRFERELGLALWAALAIVLLWIGSH